MHRPTTGDADGAGNAVPSGPVLSPAALACLSEIAHREAGLFLPPGKAAMVRTRLARRLRSLGLASYESYCEFVTGADGAEERIAMISALTTNVSHFFREPHHFRHLAAETLPRLIARARAGDRVRIWSAGCSNGQEPYSIAITMVEAGMPIDADVRILATDIDPSVIAFARAGTYPESMSAGIPADLRARHFVPEPAPGDGITVGPDLRRLVRFKVLNLLSDWPMQGRFDAIFCRNVVIYFDNATQVRLWSRFADALPEGGTLFLGHSERLTGAARDLFEPADVTTYRRNARSGAVAEQALSPPERRYHGIA